jgi:hypothetical protein
MNKMMKGIEYIDNMEDNSQNKSLDNFFSRELPFETEFLKPMPPDSQY